MRRLSPPTPSRDSLTSWYWSGDVIRSRSVSPTVLTSVLDIAEPPLRLVADWNREIATRMVLEPGDVEAMPLARARARWPDYTRCVQAVSEWTSTAGLPGVLATSDVALMACRGARYHHDGEQYGGAAFCNLFLSDDKNLDVHFPEAGACIPLRRGTVLVFDTGQPHGVIRRGGSGFEVADFAMGQDNTQLFLTWELSIEDAHVARALDVTFDVDGSLPSEDEQLRRNGKRAVVCPHSGRWREAD